MMFPPPARLTASLLLAGGLLAACATPAQEPAAPAAPSGRAWGEMAPIPNPPEDEVAAPPSPAPAPRRPAERQERPAPAPRETPAPAPKPSGTSQAAQAAKLRTQGLTELNRGNVDSAIRLLRQAQALDPKNALIARDLERALRISRAVRGAP